MNPPDGFVLVPVEPTREMLMAAYEVENRSAVENYGSPPLVDDVYAAMIAAAPPVVHETAVGIIRETARGTENERFEPGCEP